MKIVVYTKIRNFLTPWTNTLYTLGFLSGAVEDDQNVIGEVVRLDPERILIKDCPDLPDEGAAILRGYFGEEKVKIYED